MAANVVIEARDANGERQSSLKVQLLKENGWRSDATNRLAGFINAVLKNEAVMNVFGLRAIDRETVLLPNANIIEDCNIDVLARKSGLQKKINKRPDDQKSECVQLHIQVKVEP